MSNLDLNKLEITKDEYFNRFGENLDIILLSHDNPSDTANIFLENVQESLNDYISACFNLDMRRIFRNMTDIEKTYYKEACLEQAYYVKLNGDLLNDTGYDSRVGIIADKSKINKLAISQKAKNKLISCGIWCRKENPNRGRWYGIWFY